MKRGAKIGLSVFFLAAAAAGYGVYWWYESDLDRQAHEETRVRPDLPVDEVRGLLSNQNLRDKLKAQHIIERLAESDRVDLLKAMSDEPNLVVRLFAVTNMAKLKANPAMRAGLARLAESDPAREVRDAARDALGDPPGKAP